MSANIQVKYFNSFWLKKTVQAYNSEGTDFAPTFPGLEWNPTGYPVFPGSSC